MEIAKTKLGALVVVLSAAAALAQAPARLIPYNGVATDALGQARVGVVGVIFAIYEDQSV